MKQHSNLAVTLDTSWKSLSSSEIKAHLPFLLKITKDNLFYISPQSTSKEEIYRTFIKKINEIDLDFFLKEITRVVLHQSQYEYSWLFLEGIKHDYLVIDLLEELIYRKILKDDFFIEFMLSPEPLIPFDFRGKVIVLFITAIKNNFINFSQKSFEKMRNFLFDFKVFPRRTLEEKVNIPTDGIDSLFPIPAPLEDKLSLLSKASDYKTRETLFKDIFSFLEIIQPLVANDIQESIKEIKHNLFLKEIFFTLSTLTCESRISKNVNILINNDVNCFVRSWKDYIVCWDQQVVYGEGYTYTIAELFRICLIFSDLSSQDLRTRTEVLKFYRSMLRISGRASIGLKAGIYYGEHGTEEPPTLFYMGTDSIIGKGCIIDPVGGIAMLSKSYLGGGFIPILVHTHKHILVEGNIGTDERKVILPCILVAKSGARLPMNKSILFEAADYINVKTPYENIDVFGIDKDDETIG